MLKATAGGGGMGLMICHNEQDISENFASVQSRGDALFKNHGILLERYLPISHHVEVQLFGNGHGQVVSIGERECSIQRRHQKVIEECPSPLVSYKYPHLRAKLCECAVRLAGSVNYRSAGTAEFLVDSDTGDFFFLEMNTRLQVEHGITELAYDIDLVGLMYQQADAQLGGNGFGAFDQEGALTLQAKFIEPQWHAIEVRVYAENPSSNFAPSTGLVQQADWHQIEGTRVDTWVRAGNVISTHYDAMLAKVMQRSKSRVDAIAALRSVLSDSALKGPIINIDFLLAVLQDRRFAEGDTPTSFLDGFKFAPAVIEIISGGSYTSFKTSPDGPMSDMALAMPGQWIQ